MVDFSKGTRGSLTWFVYEDRQLIGKVIAMSENDALARAREKFPPGHFEQGMITVERKGNKRKR